MNIFEHYKMSRGKISPTVLKETSKTDLLEILNVIKRDIINIDFQTNETSIQMKKDNGSFDQRWYDSAIYSKKTKSILIQRIFGEIRIKNIIFKDEESIRNDKTSTQLLINAMKLTLTKEQEDNVLKKWRELENKEYTR